MSKGEEVSQLNRSKSMNRVEEKVSGAAGEQAGNGSDNIKKIKVRKNKNEEEQNQRDQNKFFIDVSKEKESKEMILKLLEEANNKCYGREIFLKDLVILALPKLTQKDIEKIQEGSLSEMEKVNRALDDHNKKNGTNMELGEFLVKKLNIN